MNECPGFTHQSGCAKIGYLEAALACLSINMTSSEVMPEQILHIIDASLNRVGKGLRLNTSQVAAAGAGSVAVISAVLEAESPEKAVRKIIDNHKT